MFYSVALILIIAWMLGLLAGYTMGGFIHVFLIVAIILVLTKLIRTKKIRHDKNSTYC